MAKIKLELDTRSVVNGCSQVRLRLTSCKTSVYIPTGAYVESEYFIGDLHNPIDVGSVYRKEGSVLISNVVRKYESAIFDLSRNGDIAGMSAKEIREYVDGVKRVVQKDSCSFIEFMEAYGANMQSLNTQKDYAYTTRVIKGYCAYARIHALSFSMIDYAFLSSLEKWMRKDGRGECVIFKVMTYIRSMYNEGVKRKLVSRADYPFDSYKIRRPEAGDEIHTLSIDGMRKLMQLDLTDHPACKTLSITRDVLLISFYLCGANLIDIFGMKEQDGYAVFIRHKLTGKTKRPVRIRIDNELRGMMDKYSSTSTMFGFNNMYASFNTFQTRIDHKCKVLSELIGEKIDMATIRRTWVTYAARLDISDRVIEKSIGHKDKTVTGIHYEEYDWERTARANRMVIDYASGATE